MIDREYWVNQIISGVIRIEVDDQEYIVRKPTPSEKYYASYLAGKVSAKAAELELYDDDQILKILEDNDVWTDENQNMFDQLTKDIEKLKIKLYEMFFKKREKDTAIKLLTAAKKKYGELYSIRHSYDYMTISGAAFLAKQKYLVGTCLMNLSGQNIFPNESFLKADNTFIEKVLHAVTQSKPNESIIRELARTEPWRTIWACRHSEHSVFGCPAIELSDEQKYLTAWTRTYDNAQEQEDCPEEEIINYDDAFDGWLINKVKNKTNMNRSQKYSQKHGDAGEVFIVDAQPGESTGNITKEDMEYIDNLNSPQAKQQKNRRLAFLAKHDAVNELDMPDTKEKIMKAVHAKHK